MRKVRFGARADLSDETNDANDPFQNYSELSTVAWFVVIGCLPAYPPVEGISQLMLSLSPESPHAERAVALRGSD